MSILPTKEVTSKVDLLCSVSRMYYTLGMNQQAIAQKLNISRSSVARFLSEAREYGIVEIKVKGIDDSTRNAKIEDALRTKYKMKEVVVVANVSQRVFLEVSAAYLMSILPYDGIVAIGGGATLYSIMQHLRPAGPRNKLMCMQATGVLSEAVPSTAVVQSCAENLSAIPSYINLPGIVSDTGIRQQLIRESMFDMHYKSLKKADICICGVGETDQFMEKNIGSSVLNPYWDKIKNNCVGDVCFHLFDKNGDFCMPEISECVCGLSIEDFLKIPVRIAAATGENKVAAIRAALTGRLINILLTDIKTAQGLI